MAGKMTDGSGNHWDQKAIRAYAEGVEARQNATNPTNPFAVTTEPEYIAWALGVADAAAETGVETCVANHTGAAAT